MSDYYDENELSKQPAVDAASSSLSSLQSFGNEEDVYNQTMSGDQRAMLARISKLAVDSPQLLDLFTVIGDVYAESSQLIQDGVCTISPRVFLHRVAAR